MDDEPYITDVLAAALRFEGFDIEVAATGAQALSMALPGGFDMIVLDVMLPDLEGIEVCHQLRSAGTSTPVLFLTARDTSGDKLAGLAVGDDYVTKPFSIDELVARIRAVLRRTMPDGSDLDGRLRFVDLVMDDETHEVWRANELIELTATEFNLLRYLLVNARRVVSKSEILSAGVGLRLRGRRQYRRDLHQLPTQEDRPLRSAPCSHHPACRLQLAGAPDMRLPRRFWEPRT